MSTPVILALNVQYGLVGVCATKDYKGADEPYPHGFKALLDAGVEFDQVDAEFDSDEMIDAFVKRFKTPEPHWVPDTAEEAKKDAKITSLYYIDDVFRKYFTSPYVEFDKRIGQPFTVLGHDIEAEAEQEEEESEPMYKIQFPDGEIITAWAHEVCVLDRLRCSGRKYGEEA